MSLSAHQGLRERQVVQQDARRRCIRKTCSTGTRGCCRSFLDGNALLHASNSGERAGKRFFPARVHRTSFPTAAVDGLADRGAVMGKGRWTGLRILLNGLGRWPAGYVHMDFDSFCWFVLSESTASGRVSPPPGGSDDGARQPLLVLQIRLSLRPAGRSGVRAHGFLLGSNMASASPRKASPRTSVPGAGEKYIPSGRCGKNRVIAGRHLQAS
jgi:hypothetical protein